MQKYGVGIMVMLLLFASCAQSAHDDGRQADPATTSTETAIDYQTYANLDLDTYQDLESLPPDLKQEVQARALMLVKLRQNAGENTAVSTSVGSTLKSVACLLFHCWKPITACILDNECRSQLLSLGKCVGKGGDAMMLCFIAAFSQPCDKLLAMMSCLGECMPEPVPHCAVPTNRDQIAPVTLADLEGDWYVVRGLSPVYDCWSGQRYSFHQTGTTTSIYDYTYFPVDKDSPVAIKCTTTAIPFASDETEICPGRFRINYTAYGMPGVDDWYCLSHPTADYVLIYYCGASPLDSYVGGIVLSRTLDTAIPQAVLDDFSAALANAGLSDPVTLADFCTPDNTGIVYGNLASSWESAVLPLSAY